MSSGKDTSVERYEINLGEALAHDAAINLQLQPNDHLIVRSIPDFNDRYMMTLKGAVRFPGKYAIGKGETLSSVLERAGGFTDKSYLRGAVFSRESLKEAQQKQIDKLIAEEQQQLSRIAQEIAVGAMSAEESKSAETLLENRKTLIEDLKKTPPTGRLVIALTELNEFKGSPQDIMLMDRDELIIPENPPDRQCSGRGSTIRPRSAGFPAKPSVTTWEKSAAPRKPPTTTKCSSSVRTARWLANSREAAVLAGTRKTGAGPSAVSTTRSFTRGTRSWCRRNTSSTTG